jgi:hypothetical protein
MSIPLDRLYHYIESLCGDDIVIYRWHTHGSKNLDDLALLRNLNVNKHLTSPLLIAHDQEPLDYELFENYCSKRTIAKFVERLISYDSFAAVVNTMPKLKRRTNPLNIYEKTLLCHSEKNSPEVEKFNSYFIGVYYWCHALIARDWFRFAEHDRYIVNDPLHYNYDFLIYNRAWSGTREYRLKFAELLIDHQLVDCSLIKFSPIDTNQHYTEYKFKNKKFQISNYSMELEIPDNTSSSDDSADYVSSDYNSCGIEIILETLFDDTRNHLTEKTLRAVACGKPFILASTPGSLQYLRDYGFKTFHGIIDESYDTLQDPVERLESIVSEMKKIKNLNSLAKLELFNKLNDIAVYNKNLFFSPQFQKSITDEFTLNFNIAIKELEKFKNGKIWNIAKEIMKNDPEIMRLMCNTYTEDAVHKLNQMVDQHVSTPC